MKLTFLIFSFISTGDCLCFDLRFLNDGEDVVLGEFMFNVNLSKFTKQNKNIIRGLIYGFYDLTVGWLTLFFVLVDLAHPAMSIV